jgi:hypothetical protein
VKKNIAGNAAPTIKSFSHLLTWPWYSTLVPLLSTLTGWIIILHESLFFNLFLSFILNWALSCTQTWAKHLFHDWVVEASQGQLYYRVGCRCPGQMHQWRGRKDTEATKGHVRQALVCNHWDMCTLFGKSSYPRLLRLTMDADVLWIGYQIIL